MQALEPAKPSFPWKRVFLFIDVIAVAILCGLLLAKHSALPKLAIPEPEWTLARATSLPPEQIDHIDIAILNLVCAEGFDGVDAKAIAAYLQTLDQWTEHVRSEIERKKEIFYNDPAYYKNSLSVFEAATLVNTLQTDYQVHYDPTQIGIADFLNPKDTFLHGILGKDRYGTCSDMPVLYVAVGRRLGFPLHLVTTPEHVFARWENEDGSVRFNIEGTATGMGAPSDAHYVQDVPHATEEIMLRNGFLKNLTGRQEFALFLSLRGSVFEAQGKLTEAQFVYALAARYDLSNTGIFVRLALAVDKRNLAHAGLLVPVTPENSHIVTPLVAPKASKADQNGVVFDKTALPVQ